MTKPTLVKLAAVSGACAAIGAGAGLLGSASASSQGSSSTAAKAAKQKPRAGLRALRKAVHFDAVVSTATGGFVDVSMDRGIVQSVSGNQITLGEGTRNATYKTVTLTVPASAIVHDSGRLAQLSDVKPGQMAFVYHGPKHTRVGAHDVH